mgnify:FL=1
MKQLLKHMRDVAGVVTMACVVLFVPMAEPTGAATIHHPYWIDDIQGAITFYKGGGYYKKAYPGAHWDLYIEQMQVVRSAYEQGDTGATYVAMNRFMDMLEAREGGIPVQPANELFNLCNFVTPSEFHDVTRHAGPPRIEQPKMPEGAEWPG